MAVDRAGDTRRFFVTHDLVGYEVPVGANIPPLKAIFLDEVDPTTSPMKAKSDTPRGPKASLHHDRLGPRPTA